MSEFAELGKLLDSMRTQTTEIEVAIYCFHGIWNVDVIHAVSSGDKTRRFTVAEAHEYSLDTALTLVLQDLRDMANE